MTEKINNSTDLEHFKKYKVEDLTVDKTKYEFSTFKKKRLVPFTFFSKKQFKNYINKQDNNTKLSIVGNVFINKKKYKEITKDYTELDKIHDKRYGLVETRLTNNYIDKHNLEYSFAKFDLFNAKDTRKNLFLNTVGYAEVEKNTYIRLVKHSVIPFIILLFLILILICTIFLSNSKTDKPVLNFENQMPYHEEIVENQSSSSDEVAIVLKQKYVVSKENPNIQLQNYKENTKYLSYEVIKDNTIIGKTNLIKPGNVAYFDIYSKFNKKGSYQIVLKIYSYNQDGSVNDVTYDVPVEIIIN
ncbi:MAG: hypothetical protein ACLUD1_01870 [Clostridia bacterium]